MTSLNKVKIGDRLKFGKIDGIVQRITIGHVLLKTDENDTYALPNSMLTNKKFTVERSEVVKTSDNKKKK